MVQGQPLQRYIHSIFFGCVCIHGKYAENVQMNVCMHACHACAWYQQTEMPMTSRTSYVCAVVALTLSRLLSFNVDMYVFAGIIKEEMPMTFELCRKTAKPALDKKQVCTCTCTHMHACMQGAQTGMYMCTYMHRHRSTRMLPKHKVFVPGSKLSYCLKQSK